MALRRDCAVDGGVPTWSAGRMNRFLVSFFRNGAGRLVFGKPGPNVRGMLAVDPMADVGLCTIPSGPEPTPGTVPGTALSGVICACCDIQRDEQKIEGRLVTDGRSRPGNR